MTSSLRNLCFRFPRLRGKLSRQRLKGGYISREERPLPPFWHLPPRFAQGQEKQTNALRMRPQDTWKNLY
jgi:hypothetical protein